MRTGTCDRLMHDCLGIGVSLTFRLATATSCRDDLALDVDVSRRIMLRKSNSRRVASTTGHNYHALQCFFVAI